LGGVFISYRREESAFAARAIYDRIAQKVGRENVFLDVDNIDLGVDWFQVLSEKVGACDALIAVIGKNWISRAGEDDFIRFEIEGALQRDVPVIQCWSTARQCRNLMNCPTRSKISRAARESKFHTITSSPTSND
jgi:TIR domain